MAIAKVPVSGFLNFFAPHAVLTDSRAPASPPKEQFGYVLGADGRIATEQYIAALSKSAFPSNWKAYAARCEKWLGRRVWDCNSMAEGYYKEQTGVSINTQARYNYAQWCSPKSTVRGDFNLTGLPQLPGTAVFSGPTAATISHVGYLLYKHGKGDLDWYVVEARGADYGVVITMLTERDWAWWGVMEKYFIYDVGADWKPNTTIGEQRESYFALCGGSGVNIRTGRGTAFPSIGRLEKGDKMLALPAIAGWCEIAAEKGGELITGYVSAQYVAPA